jgi:flagellar basal-body rod modification protein FlgD
MSSISALTTHAGTDPTAVAKPLSALDSNAFLELLIAQMKNQDPLDPQKSSDYVAQLATFSQVEKSVQTNQQIGELLTASRLQQAGALIGVTVTSADGTISGVVAQAKIVQDSVVAVLTDGRELTLDSGVTFSRGDA